MRPLPRLHAVTDAAVIAAPDFGVRAAAIAAAGSAVALHARDRTAGGAMLARLATRLLALARPPEAAVFVNGRPDVAAAVGAQGVQLAGQDLPPADARRVLGPGWIGRSVHGVAEAESAVAEGADFLLVGSVYPTASHPGRAPAAARARARRCGARAAGDRDRRHRRRPRAGGARGRRLRSRGHRGPVVGPDPAAAALALLAPWTEDA